jgi:HEAT repeat protein
LTFFSRATGSLDRAILAILAVMAIPRCSGNSGPDPQGFLAERTTEVLETAEEDGPESTERLVGWLAGDPDRRVRALAAEALGRREATGAATEALAASLRDGDPLVRSAAAMSMAQVAPERALVEALRTGPHDPPDRAAWAVAVLEEGIDDESRGAAALTLAAIVDGAGDPAVRSRALEALGRMGAPSAARVVQRAMDDTSWEVRASAVGALARIVGPEARRALMRVAESDPHPTVRRRARQAIEEEASR